MILPIERKFCRLTTDFHEMRPINSATKTHNHGAWDLGASVGTKIIAPEDGAVFYFFAVRDSVGSNSMIPVKLPFDIKQHNYFYDMYGGVIVLLGRQYTHVITHSYMNQLYNRNPIDEPKSFFASLLQSKVKWTYQEQNADSRFPVFVFHTGNDLRQVRQGDHIGFVGNAGFSTGAHIHWEIHKGNTWNAHKDRVDPATIFGGVF